MITISQSNNNTSYLAPITTILNNLIDSYNLAVDPKKIIVANNIISNIYPNYNYTTQTYNVTQVRNAENALNSLNSNILNNMIEGQTISMYSTLFVNQISKISSFSSNDLNIFSNGETGFIQFSPLYLNNSQIRGIMNYSNASTMAILMKYNSNKMIPIKLKSNRYAFSEDSVNLTIQVKDLNSKKYRRLQSFPDRGHTHLSFKTYEIQWARATFLPKYVLALEGRGFCVRSALDGGRGI